MSDSQVYPMTCWCKDVMTNVPGTHDRGCDEVVRLRAALAASQADVTRLRDERDAYRAQYNSERDAVQRLAAELAESVRALAVSQGEVAALKQEVVRAYFNGAEDFAKHHFAEGGCKHAIAVAAEKSRGDLERARKLLAEAEDLLCDWWNGWATSKGGTIGPLPGTEADTQALVPRLRAFLAPPTPTASAEPDRASPEVTVKETP